MCKVRSASQALQYLIQLIQILHETTISWITGAVVNKYSRLNWRISWISLDIKAEQLGASVRGRQWKACKCNAFTNCISTSHHPKKKRKKTKLKLPKSAIPLAIPFTGIATISTGRGCQLERKWRALTSIIQNLTSSLCFSSPPLFLCLSLLSFQRQATHRPRRTHEAAAEHYHLPDMGQQKPKPHGYIGRGQSTILSPADTQSFHGWIYKGTNYTSTSVVVVHIWSAQEKH